MAAVTRTHGGTILWRGDSLVYLNATSPGRGAG